MTDPFVGHGEDHAEREETQQGTGQHAEQGQRGLRMQNVNHHVLQRLIASVKTSRLTASVKPPRLTVSVNPSCLTSFNDHVLQRL